MSVDVQELTWSCCLSSLQTCEAAVLKWREKQKIVFSARSPAGTKKGEGRPAGVVQRLCPLTGRLSLQTPARLFQPRTVPTTWSRAGTSGGRRRGSSGLSNT